MGYDRLDHYSRTPTFIWRKRGQQSQALGRSCGGFSTKIHAACESLGNPIRFILSPGQSSDYTQAEALLDGFEAEFVLGDKGYDADYVISKAQSIGAQEVIPPKENRLIERIYDKELYKERNLDERRFNKLKNFRRVATRYDKTASAFLAFVQITRILIWLR